MKALVIILTLLLGIGFLAVAVQLSKSQPAPSKELPKLVKASLPVDDGEPIPVVADHGPYPKAVVPETEYDFGAMPLYGEGSKVFIVKNEGEAPLEVVVREKDTSCQCTVGTVEGGLVPPGGQTTVELKWEIKVPVPKFRHTAKIRTNDPDNKVIEMAITGKVEKDYHLLPDSLWDLGSLPADEEKATATVSGVIFSRMKKEFAIQEIVSPSGRVKGRWEPLSPEELKEHEALSGYKVTVDVDLEKLVGKFSEGVEIKTVESELPAVRFTVKASRAGPIEILARNWDAEHSTLMLGEFPAEGGKSAELSVYARIEEDIHLLSAESEHQAVTATWTKDEKFQSKSGAKRYRLKLDVLPGKPTSRMRDESEKLQLTFDHPKIGSMTIYVSYLGI